MIVAGTEKREMGFFCMSCVCVCVTNLNKIDDDDDDDDDDVVNKDF
jgi:hypothetical protein